MQTKNILLSLCLWMACSIAQAECAGSTVSIATELEAQLQEIKKQLAATPEGDRDKLSYRHLQERGLTLLEELQCSREAEAPTEAARRGLDVATAFATVPVLLITDRAKTQSTSDADRFFGPERQAVGITFGRVDVRMPAENYVTGDTPPVGIKVVSVEHSSDGISVALPSLFEADKFSEQIDRYKAQLRPQARVRVLLFIHGFNVSYKDSVQAAARLAWGLRLDVLPIAITWPSQAKILRYWQDEQAIEPSTERLRPVIQEILSHSSIDEVIIVAHSMGTRLTTRVLSQLNLQKAAYPKLTRVAFAAADINEEELRELWPRIKEMPKKGWTFYTSGNDFALQASSIVHARPPVGDSRDRIFTSPPANTIDASAIAPALKGYGHSYLIDNPLLQADLRRWIFPGAPVVERGLKKEIRPPSTTFWIIPAQ